jgi:hypothetical protein
VSAPDSPLPGWMEKIFRDIGEKRDRPRGMGRIDVSVVTLYPFWEHAIFV